MPVGRECGPVRVGGVVSFYFFIYLFSHYNFEFLRNKLKFKIAGSNSTDGAYICNFIENLDGHNKVLLL